MENESTTTKALFDFLNVLHNGSAFAAKLLDILFIVFQC
jgi:hypothetical protein